MQHILYERALLWFPQTGTLSWWTAESVVAPDDLHLLVFKPCVIPLSVECPIEYSRGDGMSPLWLCYDLCVANRCSLLLSQLVYFDDVSSHVGEVHKTKIWGQTTANSCEGSVPSAQQPSRNWILPTTFPSWAFRWDHSLGWQLCRSLVRNPKTSRNQLNCC